MASGIGGLHIIANSTEKREEEKILAGRNTEPTLSKTQNTKNKNKSERVKSEISVFFAICLLYLRRDHARYNRTIRAVVNQSTNKRINSTIAVVTTTVRLYHIMSVEWRKNRINFNARPDDDNNVC